MEWEQKYPLSTVTTLTREVSDHTPLLLNSGDSSTYQSPPLFKFELGWLLRDGFVDTVREIWESETSGSTSMEGWQARIHRFIQHLRG